MQKVANELKPGDKCLTGEIIKKVDPIKHKKKVVVTLENGTKTRVAAWGYYSTIFLDD